MENISDTIYTIAKDLYEDADFKLTRNGEVESISVADYDDYNGYYNDCSIEDFNAAKQYVEDLVSKVKYYDGKIELNDNHTLWNIDIPDGKQFDNDEYAVLYQMALQNMEDEIGTEVYGLGRSGRHICVDDTFNNLCDYDKLKEVQRKWEQWLIDAVQDSFNNQVTPNLQEGLVNGESVTKCPECGSFAIYTNKDVIKDLDGDYVVCPQCNTYITISSAESSEIVKEIDRISEYLGKNEVVAEVDIDEDGDVQLDIAWGDWKHDHLRADNLMKQLGYELVGEDVTEDDGSDCYSAIRTYKKSNNVVTEQDNKFRNGDKVKIDYISDANEHNGKVGTLSNMRKYKYYPNGKEDEFEYKHQGVIKYDDGTEEKVSDLYRKGSGLVSPVDLVESKSIKRESMSDWESFVDSMAEDDYVSGQILSTDDFDEFKHILKDEDVNLSDEEYEDAFNYYFECIDKYKGYGKVKESVTEYTITFTDGDDFITEDKDEADARFEELKQSSEFENIEQYYAKTWVFDFDSDEYVEDYVEVYYTKGDLITESEDLNQVKADIEDALNNTESTEQEIEQVKGSLDVLKTDEESAIEGYEDFKKETDKVVDKELADAVNDQMQEIVDDEKEHIEKLDAVKNVLGESVASETKLNKDNVDTLEVGDILADDSNRYVVVDMNKSSKSVSITVRDEKDWRPIYSTPITKWYGTTIIKGPFIRQDGKVVKEESKSVAEEIAEVHGVMGNVDKNIAFKELSEEEQFKVIFAYLTEVEYEFCLGVKSDYENGKCTLEDVNNAFDTTIKELKDLIKDYPDKKETLENAINKFRIAKDKHLKENLSDSIDLEQLANDIVDWYSNDMGTWFDDIQGQEEDVYNDTLSVLESRDIATITQIIEDMEEDGSDDVMVLVDKLKELLPKDTLQEDLAPTIKESLNTGVLPIIDVDMYSIISSGMIDEYDIPDDGMESLDEIVKEVAPKYIKETLNKVLPSAEIQVTGVYHPKQYNFSGDELEFELVVSGNEYNELKEKAVADASFEQYLKDNYSSRSGFVSSMPDSLNEFNNAPEWKQLVQVIMFALKDTDLKSVNDAYLEEFFEKLGQEFPYIENDLEESKKVEESKDDTIGEIQEDGTVVKKHYRQGYVYKNFDNFDNKSGPCYISEYQGEEYTDEKGNSKTKNFNDMVEGEDYETYDTIIKQVRDGYKERGMDVSEQTIEDTAELVFDDVDWQTIDSRLQEILDSEEELAELGESKKTEANTFGIAEDMYNRTHKDKWHTLSDDEKAEYYNKNYKRIIKQAGELDKKTEDKKLLNEDAVKEWWVGDPCYVLSDEIYDDIWGKKYDYSNGLIDCGNGLSFDVHGTAYGDGSYKGSNGFWYAVDSGTLAVIPKELIGKEDGLELGTLHKSTNGEIEYEDGVFHIEFDNEILDIDTDPTDDDDLGLSESKLLKNKEVNE